MTSEPKEIMVECPACGHCYESVYRPSMNLGLERFSAEYMERMSTGTCPRCAYKASLGVLVSEGRGLLTIQAQEARFRTKEEPALYLVQINGIDPAKKVSVMKVLRSLTHLNLGEVKAVIDHLPQTSGLD